METKQDTLQTPLMAETSTSTTNTNISEQGSQTNSERYSDQEPPDGGCWAWLVLLGCFLVNGIIFGIINTFGILFVQLKADMDKAGVEDAASKCGERDFNFSFQISINTTSAALIGSLTIGTTFFLSFLVGILSDRIGLRLTSIIGSVLATLGMGLSALLYQHIEVLYLTYGIMFGAGASLVYTPSLTILGHYFKKKLGVVNGLVTAGSSIFTIGLSFINQHILETQGVGMTGQVMDVLTIVCFSWRLVYS